MRYALAALLLLLPAAALADVGPEGEWVATGPPAGTAGTLVTFPDGTVRLVGPNVQLYHPDTARGRPPGHSLVAEVSSHSWPTGERSLLALPRPKSTTPRPECRN